MKDSMDYPDWDKRITTIKEAIQSGEIENITRNDLTKFNAWLCHFNARMYFNDTYFQVCETVRFYLLKSFIDSLDRKNAFVQKIVLILTGVSVASTIIQVFLACY